MLSKSRNHESFHRSGTLIHLDDIPAVHLLLRLSVRSPAGHSPSGTPLPFRELGLFLQQCVSRHKGKELGIQCLQMQTKQYSYSE